MGRRGSIRPEVASRMLAQNRRGAARRRSDEQRTATDAYADAVGKIDGLMAELRDLLAGHKTAQQADPENWGHAGDLGNVREHLANAVNSLKGSDG